MPGNFIFMAFYFVLSKVYANSFLAALNTRRISRGRGTDAETATMPTFLMVGKVTQRTVNFDADNQMQSNMSPTKVDKSHLTHYHWERGEQPGAAYYPTEFHPVDLLFGPELKEADISFRSPYGDADHATDVVRTLAGVAPALEHLNVEVNSQLPCTWDAGSLHCKELGLFTRLTSFTGRTVCISPDALVALGSLPCLESLLVHIYPNDHSWDMLPHERRADFFPALQQLVLHKIGFEWCASFLRVLASASLRALSLRCEHHELPPPLLLEDLCAAISEHPSCGAITDLFITIGYTEFQPGREDFGLSLTYWSDQYSESETYRPETITPLFTAMPALQRLVIEGQCITIVDDSMLDSISQRCPNIVELVLAWDPDVEPRPDDERAPEDDDFPRVTPSGLLHLVRHCPRLHTLALAVNMSRPPPSRTGRSPAPPLHLSGPAVHPLRKFDVTGSLLGDRVVAASVFSLLFPQLSELSCRFAEEEDWLDVTELYTQLVRIRKQERVCAEREGRRRLREPDLSVDRV
ncbi:hypothetical protein TRAPUB_13644 [Trametes pubescens]|uniref:DUF6534 domain-containing protein n=1 Tax=Trametes pubescens TaxID=154538 RepID=A0A1M2VQL5_TRAPU|nr:hypothetical protein TRAPUB_13644 [Trametes pubescens]